VLNKEGLRDRFSLWLDLGGALLRLAIVLVLISAGLIALGDAIMQITGQIGMDLEQYAGTRTFDASLSLPAAHCVPGESKDHTFLPAG
jgi:hypothetical protein